MMDLKNVVFPPVLHVMMIYNGGVHRVSDYPRETIFQKLKDNRKLYLHVYQCHHLL